VEFQFFAAGKGHSHSITVNGRTYSHTEINPDGESSATQAAALIAAINEGNDPDVTASTGSISFAVRLTVRSERAGISIPVSASDGNASVALRLITPEIVAANLTNQINQTDWAGANTTHALIASCAGPRITVTAARYGAVSVSGVSVAWLSGARFTGVAAGSTILINGTIHTVAEIQSPTQLILTAAAPAASNASYVAPRGGRDGNFINLLLTSKTATLSFDRSALQLAGGSSDVTWNCSLDFSALGIDQLRQCWLTFAPALTIGTYTGAEWEAVFSNWQLSGPEEVKALAVSGPGTVRIEAMDKACAWHGAWTVESGFYSKYFAKATSDMGASVTITYNCQLAHDLYIGTSLYVDRAVAGLQLDGDVETALDCRLDTGSAVVTRRKVRADVGPGRHTLTIRLQQSGVFCFDFLEAAVPSDVPDALEPRRDISPALDFDTDHTYKLTPSRLMWSMDKLGYAGPMNEYLGVFWWNERVLSGGSVSQTRMSFAGEFAAADSVLLTLNGTALGKTVFPGDTPELIANHFASYINGAFTGAWASASGSELTITGRSPAPAYNITLSKQVTSTTGSAVITQTPIAGQYGTWVVDDVANPPVNRATRDWHADFYARCATRGQEVVTACSMELVNPPDGFSSRFPDSGRTAVATATGFGSLVSNHCAAGSAKLLAYQKAVYRSIAGMQAAAGLTPSVQYGEFLWWYFSGPGGMGFYDEETLAAATMALGRPLHVFAGPDDDPSVNDWADALFLRSRLRDHVATLVSNLRAAYPSVKCEVLWPADVNHATPVRADAPILGGQLNRFINLPIEWMQKASSGLDRMKIEGLAFGTSLRDLDLVREAVEFFPNAGWPVESLRYLVPVFGTATPWHRELAIARGAGITVNNLWAFDHVCLLNLDVPEPALERRSVVKTI